DSVSVRRRMPGGGAVGAAGALRPFATLVADYEVDARVRAFRVDAGSPLIGRALLGLEVGGARSSVLGIQRRRLLRGTQLLTSAETTIERGDAVVFDLAPPDDRLEELGLHEIELPGGFFDTYSRQVGMAELLVTPETGVAGKSVVELRFRAEHDVTVLGLRHAGRASGAALLERR